MLIVETPPASGQYVPFWSYTAIPAGLLERTYPVAGLKFVFVSAIETPSTAPLFESTE
ncbi:hypothetical protein [Thermoanaerobacterium sp. RBIITD]|uniref:hypothetical protein n=1 Tax=Thermoanaerobacterium sp. RBIITD TaxID=1550240 RepID=UPI0012FD1F41|nr:hypothetical protein [Thermoanaerobacterium sp. RBIITD]